ncbi:MAG: hypothetical protein VX475_21505, partial [Myxococcota bacterium]|nr:hypothetical protein [Myxococcota bacterium]
MSKSDDDVVRGEILVTHRIDETIRRPVGMQGAEKMPEIKQARTARWIKLTLAALVSTSMLACTSGSAGSHYLPALIEASHDRLPLVALTADRPPELHGVGAPQTTTQRHLFSTHV